MIKRSGITDILFKRQTIVQTNLSAIQVISIILILYFIVFAVVLYSKSDSLFEFKYRIDDNCINYPCQFYMRVDKTMETKFLYVYIGFDNFFVNHRKVAQSLAYGQLENTEKEIEKFKESCEGYYTLETLNSFFPDIRNYEPEGGVINPCGLYPLLYTQCKIIRRYQNYKTQSRNF